MLPSLLARDIQSSLKQFLISGFEPADAFLHGLMSRFVDDEAGWLKGPYVQLGLPFAPGSAGKKFFEAFETEYPGYQHQEQAWQRLSSKHLSASTLVATGTGSGKTECFLLPLLDHCARARKAGEAGIKALVIYPMNALATDQARRIASLVSSVPAFKGLRVGLYIGGSTSKTGEGTVMTPDGVITDRETLRKNPPDVLLTNYKMLDYLLLRPKDRPLWAQNTPETLRYIVVDELHTFDGAQGTDLALLLRRLRARLGIADGHLICAGTSATLGGASDTAPLREYAGQIFGMPFASDSVITETRLSVDAFIGDAMIEHMFVWHPGADALLDPSGYRTPQAAVRAWFALFFPNADQPADDAIVADDEWRRQLGEHLKKHQLFVNLLRLARNGVIGYPVLEQAFSRNLPGTARAQVTRLVDALLVMVAWARRSGAQPLVTLRVQLWVRELRRMVGRLAVDPSSVMLRSERDLPAARDGVYLPMVQCRQCRTTGWLSRLPPAGAKLSTDLDEIYNAWFSRRPEVARLYALASVGNRSQVEIVPEHACPVCGHLQAGSTACLSCTHRELLPVVRVTAQRTQTAGNAQFTRHDDTCPSCGGRDELLLLGARNATLGSQIVDASWASVFNDDKKLIAFSDSVQDAAHRAGFFGARTWQNNVRTLWSRVLDELAVTREPWSAFLIRAEKQFEAKGSVLERSPESLVSEFIAPDMTWQHDWSVQLLQKGYLPPTSRLPGRIRKRLLWQLFTDLTYLSQRGRTLERIGKAVLSVPWSRVEAVAAKLLPGLVEQYGARGLDLPLLTHWLWGTLTHMRRRGGVLQAEMAGYAEEGNVWALARLGGRGEWMPKMGDFTPRPVLLTLGRHRHFDKLTTPGRPTWYDRWASAVLGHRMLLAPGLAADLYQAAFAALIEEGVLVRRNNAINGDALAVHPDALVIDTEVAFIATAGGKRRLAVPRVDAERLLGMPCLDAVESEYRELVPDASGWWARRFSRGDLRRVIAGEHTGLLDRDVLVELEQRFKHRQPQPWFENLLSATPTLEMGVDIGDLSSVLLCSVPPNQASFLQRIGRAGRRDGNAVATTLADGSSPHDLYFFDETEEMIAGEVAPPGVFLKAAEVLRRQLFAFCMDGWVAGLDNDKALPDKTSPVIDAVEHSRTDRFPYLFCDYVLKNELALYDRFIALLGADADDVVRSRLKDYLEGQGEANGLRVGLLKALQELVEERKACKMRKDQLDVRKAALLKLPQDEATARELDDLQRERDKQLELIKEINGHDLLNTLTDAGLIPNYAFPENGIQLKSVLWRRRTDDDPGQGRYVTLATQKYERPAHSALSEFAPENRFYANQRRVEIDQINMNLAKVEPWRFCPSCHHMQNLDVDSSEHPLCPRCTDPMWADGGQRRTLLRFRQAIANSDDTEVRIDDSAEDREPRFHVRQLMADFEAKDIREAWRLPAGETPFGFEFIARVRFRDVNFGERAKPGDTFRIADREEQRPGFRLCRHCGKVQKPPRANQPPAQEHAFDCPKQGSDDPLNLIDCLYLYREFDSEALRILVPYTKHGVDEDVVQSFMAAMQLGLKRRFGGRVDHLRLVLQDEPGKDGAPRRHYVMLYDSVPGGTGYLHQLLARDAQTLADVLRLALQALETCACNANPEKDGCYRCLYQYRLGRKMEEVSRDRARAVLKELVDSLPGLEPVKTISDIYINPAFDSVLEQRFIESLRKLGGVAGLPKVQISQDIVHGKSGYVLEIGGHRYSIEPQVELGHSEGVVYPCKPDFMIRPWSASSKRKPIAVLCDGWQFHQNSLDEDARKRSALVATGRYQVCSVTANDVTAALAGNPDTDLESPLTTMSRHEGVASSTAIPAQVPRAGKDAFRFHAITRLLQGLASTVDANGNDTDLIAMQKASIWLGFLTIPPTPTDQKAGLAQMARWLPKLPIAIREPGPGHAPMISRSGGPLSLVGYWPMKLANGMPATGNWRVPGLLLLDASEAVDDGALRTAWRRWISLFNTLQSVPGLWLATASGLEKHDYDVLSASSPAEKAASAGAAAPAMGSGWSSVIDQAMPQLAHGLTALAHAGFGIPEVGLELADDKGQCVADAELAWLTAQLVILRPDQADLAGAWTSAGWAVLVLDEAMEFIDGQPWRHLVAARLEAHTQQAGETV